MNKQKIILSAFGSVFLAIFLYIVLHESGHCLVAVFCGAKITEFSILGAHMSYEGGTFNSITSSLLNAAGMMLPIVVSCVYLLFYSQTKNNLFYRVFSYMFALVPFFSLIAWIFIPMLYYSGNAPANDDITKFIYHSGINPWIVSFVAVIILTCGATLAWKKRIVQNLLESIPRSRSR